MKWRMPQFLCWSSPYPFPKDTAETVLAEGQCENFGLLLDRYLAYGEERGRAQLVREFVDRRALVPDYSGLEDLILAQRARWDRSAAALGAVSFTARPEWRVVVGLGSHAPLQGGITLHRVYGLPLIPASALKGVCRAYAERVADMPADELKRLFGTLEGEALRGDLVFLDGIPSDVPQVERDLINPIFSNYYLSPDAPPADYFSPKPIFFLAIGRHSPFRFGVGSLSGDPAAARRGAACLQAALEELGVGAKTAAGYGYWVVQRDPQPTP